MNKNLVKTVVNEFINYVKLNITELAQKELSNTEKKNKLDKAVYTYLETLILSVNINIFTKWFLENFILKNISIITQSIYDLLKTKLDTDCVNANNSETESDKLTDEV